ncbi:MAG: acyl carrier protein [Clostridia bacterium]|nr:acyl carrier protein [Clostridia bacterium]
MQELIALIENYVEVDEIKAEDNFKFNLGMSSFDTMCLITDIKTELGVEVTPADFIRLKTVGNMADFINSKK